MPNAPLPTVVPILLCTAWLLATATGQEPEATAPAQSTQPAARPAAPPYLLGNRLYDARELQPGPRLPGVDALRPRIAADGSAVLDHALVDPARSLFVVEDGDHLRRIDLPGTERWRRPCSELGLRTPLLLPQAALTEHLLLLPDQDDDLVAIALADGKVRWRDQGGEHGGLVHDAELLACFVATTDGRVARLLSLANGAKAAEVKAMPEAEFLVLGPHGFVVAGATGGAAFARTGPALFAVAGDVHGAIADSRGFCLHVGDELVAFDATGKERWRAPLVVKWPNQFALAATPNGLVVVTRSLAASDAGATLQAHDPATGEIAWQRELPPLGVDHSKYWHDVVTFVRGEQIVVTSHAAGGHWLCLLDLRGELTARVTAK